MALLVVAGSAYAFAALAQAALTQQDASYASVIDSKVVAAQAEVRRIADLVQQGALPPKRLLDAESALSDAEDDCVLANTLYGGKRVQDLSTEQAVQMVAAAGRRVQRQEALAASKTEMVESGLVAKSEAQPALDELEVRKRTLQLAHDRSKLLDDLLAMARAEQALEQSRSASLSSAAMIRYDGTSHFDAAVFQNVNTAYLKRFHQDLPVSALGQTLVHQELGFDHRGRVDVALNPDAAEGLWLRRLLERQHISYLAFRGAMSGSGTGPHIHIGPGSLRVRIPPPPDVQVNKVVRLHAIASGT